MAVFNININIIIYRKSLEMEGSVKNLLEAEKESQNIIDAANKDK